MDIFESLENLNVSEECFEDIMGLVEEIINEVSDEWKQMHLDNAAEKTRYFGRKYDEAKDKYRKERSSKNGDYVLDASALFSKHQKREEKLRDAIKKHNKAKAEGRIKTTKKEEKEDDCNK